MDHQIILSTVNAALQAHPAFLLPCDDIHPGYLLPLVSVEMKSLTRHYHESFWGDERDHGVAPLLCMDLSGSVSAANSVDNDEIIKVIAQAFDDQMGVRLFKCSLEQKVITRLVKGKVITQLKALEFKMTASQDYRLVDIDA